MFGGGDDLDPKHKWNKKHQERISRHGNPLPNPRLMKLSSYISTGGNALDFACGLGPNSLYIAERGLHVKAVDISDIAIQYVKEQAEKRQLSIDPVVSDLTDWKNMNLMIQSFDLIIITYYLDRTIFPRLKSMTKKDGYLFMETYFVSPSSKGDAVSERFKLKPGELLSVFQDWQILFYEENEHEGRQTIFARNS